MKPNQQSGIKHGRPAALDALRRYKRRRSHAHSRHAGRGRSVPLTAEETRAALEAIREQGADVCYACGEPATLSRTAGRTDDGRPGYRGWRWVGYCDEHEPARFDAVKTTGLGGRNRPAHRGPAG
jgi:hypothetical protein